METFRLSPTVAPLIGGTSIKSFSHSRLRGPLINRHASIKPFVHASLSLSEEEKKKKKNSSASIRRVGVFGPMVRGVLWRNDDKEEEEEEEDGDIVIDALGYLTGILKAKVYDVAVDSPMEHATKLSEKLGTKVWMKREDQQPNAFSFKMRGAYNMMSNVAQEKMQKGFISASVGNHGQGVALAGSKLGCESLVVMPTTTPQTKIEAVEKLGGKVIQHGDDFEEAMEHARQLAEERDMTFVPPYDHPDIIMGHGTIGMEIVRQMQGRGPLSAIFVPVGGGGLIAGVASYVKRVMPEVKIIGVEPSGANSMQLSLEKGEIVRLDKVGTFADMLAVKEVGKETFRLCQELVDDMVVVDDAAVSAAIKDMYEETNSILEPSGGIALAAAESYLKGNDVKGEVVAITSGGNVDFHKLKTVADLAEIGRGREAMLVTVIPERPGSLKFFCDQVCQPSKFSRFVKLQLGDRNITELKYRQGSNKEASILYSVNPIGPSELGELIFRINMSGLKTLEVTKDSVVQDHFRYLTGGRFDVRHEVLCRFVFPEKPGALKKFLDAFSPRWNISLFNYRISGDTTANVLVGFQIPPEEMRDFRHAADRLGYVYDFVDHRAFEALLR